MRYFLHPTRRILKLLRAYALYGNAEFPALHIFGSYGSNHLTGGKFERVGRQDGGRSGQLLQTRRRHPDNPPEPR